MLDVYIGAAKEVIEHLTEASDLLKSSVIFCRCRESSALLSSDDITNLQRGSSLSEK